MKKTTLALFLAAGLLIGLLAGCSNSGGDASKAPGPSASAAPSAEGGSDSEDTVTLTLMRTGTPEVLHGIFDPIIAQFEKDHPNIKIDMQDLGWGDAEKTLQTMSASKTLPDVMYHLPATIFDLADKGLILDLTPYVDDGLKNDMYPAMLQAGQYNGKQYMISCGGTGLIMWYNADMFEQAGLDPDAPPKTWAEFLDACEALSALDGIAPVGVYASPAGGETSFVFESLFTTEFGGSAWDPDKNQYVYDSEENKDAAVNTLQFMQDITKYAQDSYVEYGRFDSRTLLRDGKVAIVLDAINMANQIPDQLADSTIRAAAIPAGNSGVQSTSINLGGWFIPTNCEHPDEAWTFLRYMMETENQLAHAAYGSVPMLRSEAENYTEGYMVDVIDSLNNSYPEGICIDTNALWAVNGEQLQLLMMGSQSAEETWKNISAEHGEIYN